MTVSKNRFGLHRTASIAVFGRAGMGWGEYMEIYWHLWLRSKGTQTNLHAMPQHMPLPLRALSKGSATELAWKAFFWSTAVRKHHGIWKKTAQPMNSEMPGQEGTTVMLPQSPLLHLSFQRSKRIFMSNNWENAAPEKKSVTANDKSHPTS